MTTTESKNRYHLLTLPEWRHVGSSSLAPDTIALWSNEADPPVVGARVVVSINGFGPGEVIGYFVEHGYLGLYVRPDVRPEWHRKQTDKDYCMVFGAEVTSESVSP